jgi:transcriptional repressor NrdR
MPRPRSSRPAVSEDGDFVRRRRQCGDCDKRFTTYERPDVNFPVVVKKDGSRADFDSKKVRASMMLALRKRPVSIEQIDGALLRIEQRCWPAACARSTRRRSASS